MAACRSSPGAAASCQPVRASSASASAASNVDLAGSPSAATVAWKRARALSLRGRDKDTLIARLLPGAATCRNCPRTSSRPAGSR